MKKGLISIGLVCIACQSLALSLEHAEVISLKRSVELKQLQEKRNVYQQLAISHSQWQDPKIELSAMNLPTNGFSLNQEAMTQLKLGLKQQLPKGRSLTFQRESWLGKANKLNAAINLKKRQILKQLRLVWAERYHWHRVRMILLKKKSTFMHLKEVTQSLYENNKVQQTDLFNAALQIAKIDQKLLNAERSYQATQASLERWLGLKLAKQSRPKNWPKLQVASTEKVFYHRLKKHPLIQQDKEEINIRLSEVHLMQESFKPDFGLGLQYAHRQGMINGQPRSDFLSFGVSVSLPLHAQNKQEKSYQASLAKLKAVRYLTQSHLEALQEKLGLTYVQWKASEDVLALYRSRIIPNARHYADAHLIRYQNIKGDFNLLANSYVSLYQLQLEKEKALYLYAKQTINLIYLIG